MTLEEAINHCEEIAGADERVADMINSGSEFWEDLLKSAKYYRQLAEWLKELKAYEKAYEEIKKLPIAWEFGEGVIRCLTIIEDCLEEVNAYERV